MTKDYFPTKDDVSIEDFTKLCNQKSVISDYPFADSIDSNVVIYNGKTLARHPNKKSIQNELHHCLSSGPGVFVVKDFFENRDIVDQNTKVYRDIIADEKKDLSQKGDHFSTPETHDRIWNAFEKTCDRDPTAFFHYYANPLFSLICEAWLGPASQITTQVNSIKPGGKSQQVHRDYHLGFQNDEITAQFPITIQKSSQYLTLQGAVAHCDMPIDSGPTKFLPFSHQYDLGYMAFRSASFVDYFEKNRVQLALQKGDALFFSPALFHGAGENKTESTERIVNLIQVSSAFGKPMETVNRQKMIKQLYPILVEQAKDELNKDSIKNIINAVADGYPFPTNLDKNPPTGSCASETSQQFSLGAIRDQWSVAKFEQQLDALVEMRI
jgi:ectoine hydroxylase-related dioxygenase (phytanoyl-CoA dioxygenase family)